MDVLITGANGVVGSALRKHFPEQYDLTCLDIDPGPEGEYGDVSDYESIRPAFEGRDAVVHLAVHPLGDDRWGPVLETNVVGTYNVLRAVKDANVGSFVFASSNHAVGLYERWNAPEIYYGGTDVVLTGDTPHRPDSFYGASKGFGEDLTCLYVNRFDYPTSARAIRICSVRDPEFDHPYGDAERGVVRGDWDRGDAAYRLQVARQKAMWQSRRDCAQLFRRCLENGADGFDVFYGVSDNERRWVDIDHAREAVGYRPEDRAEEWTAPPGPEDRGEG